MPLSRHCYSLEEVQSALWYTGSRQLPHETVFWCQELIESGCVGEAISVLFESWLWHRGPFQIQWFLFAWGRLSGSEVTAEDVVECAHRLSTCTVKDHSLWHLLYHSSDELPDRVTPRSPSCFPSDDPKEVFFVRALYQRKAQSAWWVTSYLSVDRYWELIEWCRKHWIEDVGGEKEEPIASFLEAIRQYEPLLGYRTDEYDRAIRGLVVIFFCLTPAQRQRSGAAFPSFPSLGLTFGVGEKGRAYSIPRECLYGTTRRGRSHERTEDELHDVERGMKGCPFWEETLEPYQVGGRWISEEAMDEWYHASFPNDIPDEWTAAEKEKSHGPGVVRPNERVTVEVYSRRMFTALSRCTWIHSKDTRKDTGKDSDVMGASPLHVLLSHLPIVPPLDESLLVPVHKRLVYRPS